MKDTIRHKMIMQLRAQEKLLSKQLNGYGILYPGIRPYPEGKTADEYAVLLFCYNLSSRLKQIQQELVDLERGCITSAPTRDQIINAVREADRQAARSRAIDDEYRRLADEARSRQADRERDEHLDW